MQTGVYGAGYLGTVVSACLADFGTPVTCCHPDSSRMVEMAQGNVPFFEKNLTEVIKRNVRSGRLAYSTDMESFARKTHRSTWPTWPFESRGLRLDLPFSPS
jgi:UDPglucose 6-dehydrogenase